MLLKVHPWDKEWIWRRFLVLQMNVGSRQAIRSLNLLMEAVCLRRTKDVLLNLPEKVKNYVVVHVSSKWNEALRDLHNTFIQYFGQQRTSGKPWDSHEFFRQLTMLRQFCNHPLYARLDIKNKHAWKWEDSGKIIHLVRNLKEFLSVQGDQGTKRPKAIIFSSYTGFLGM
jgi:SNF2 family DNA or RNA helicase